VAPRPVFNGKLGCVRSRETLHKSQPCTLLG
jgi:hypothetical protein